MKRFILAAAALFITHAVHADPAVQAEPTSEAVTFTKIYVPVGFDSNDHVQFVGEGTFANSCYRPAPVTTTIDRASKTIKVGPVAYKYAGFCMQVVLPFERVVDVGILPAGTWQVVQADGKAVGEIKVGPALTADPDDYLYAPVSQAFVHSSVNNGQEELMLNGTFPNNCMSMDQVKFNVQDSVIIVQPIAKMSSQDPAQCKGPATPFNQVVKLGKIPAGRYLLHVRSMNAQAINTLVDIQ